MELLLSPEILGAFIMLTMLEIVLGIDHIIFITVLTDRLPKHQQARGRYLGLALAMGLRISPLLSIAWIMSLTATVYEAFGFLVLIGFTLTVEGWGLHVPKGYLYSAMTFAFIIEILNIRASKRKPLRLRKMQLEDFKLMRKPA